MQLQIKASIDAGVCARLSCSFACLFALRAVVVVVIRNSHNQGFFHTARSMWSAGGVAPFTKGINATVMRDTTFGGVFALTKFLLARALQPYILEPPPTKPLSRTTKVVLQARAVHPTTASTTSAPTGAQTATTTAAATSTAVPPVPRFQFSAGKVDFSAALLAGLAVRALLPEQTTPPSTPPQPCPAPPAAEMLNC